MQFENLILEIDEHLATIIINRPKKLNALNKETIKELHDALSALQADSDIKVIIITGSGEKAFVAGADIAEFAHYSEAEGEELAAHGQKILFDFVEKFKQAGYRGSEWLRFGRRT